MHGGIYRLIAYGPADIFLNRILTRDTIRIMSAKIIQKAYKLYIFRKQRNNAARIIQHGCEKWLYKSVLNDGNYGIVPRLAIKNLIK